MDMIKIKCNICFKNYQVNQVHAGKKIKCKNCNNPIVIPEEEAKSPIFTNEDHLKNIFQISSGDLVFWAFIGITISTSASLLTRLIFLVAER